MKKTNFTNDNIEEINFEFLLRNKLFIGSVSIISFFLACIYSLTLKRIWEGQFQIVLEKDNKSGASSILGQLPSSVQKLANLDTAGKGLNTEVGILQSPSVLMPTFNFVNSFKEKNNVKKEMLFSKWKQKNLAIELEPGTTILNIAYRDEDKDLIIPVLEKISFTYQDYSGRSKKRSQDLNRKYLQDQIKQYKIKSSQSLRKAQEFSIEQDLLFFSSKFNNFFSTTNRNSSFSTGVGEEKKSSLNIGEIVKRNSSFNSFSNSNLNSESKSNEFFPNIGVETIRINAANTIREIDSQIQEIQRLGEDIEKLQYIGSTIPALVKEGLPQSLADIEIKLAETKSKFTEKDPVIKRMVSEREILIKLLRKRALGILEAEKTNAKAILKAAERPKGVFLKYKELIREAARDERTLVNLENQLRIAQLQESISEDPWELITDPTLKKLPVGPSRKKIGLVGLIGGFFIGIIGAIFREKKSDKVFDHKILESIFEAPVIGKIKSEDIEEESGNFTFIKDFLDLDKKDKFCLFTMGQIQTKKLSLIQEKLNSTYNLQVEDDYFSENIILKSLSDSEKVILLISQNTSKLSNIKSFSNKLNLLSSKVDGIIIFEN